MKKRTSPVLEKPFDDLFAPPRKCKQIVMLLCPLVNNFQKEKKQVDKKRRLLLRAEVDVHIDPNVHHIVHRRQSTPMLLQHTHSPLSVQCNGGFGNQCEYFLTHTVTHSPLSLQRSVSSEYLLILSSQMFLYNDNSLTARLLQRHWRGNIVFKILNWNVLYREGF